MEAIVHRNLRLEKSVKKVEKSRFIQKRDIRFHQLQTSLVEGNIVRQLDSRFFNSFD